MAHTTEGLVLTREHRRAKDRIIARTLQGTTVAYRGILDPTDLDGTFGAYSRVHTEVVKAGQREVLQLADDHYEALRQVEAPKAPPRQRPNQPWNNSGWDLRPADKARLTTSQAVTGPATVKRAVANGLPLALAMDRGLTATLGSTGRHVQNAGRGRIIDNARTDPAAGGWARSSPGTPCSFCAMLIGRGPVYSKKTVNFRSHDHCQCYPIAFFGDDGWTPQAAEFNAIWKETSKGAYGPKESRQEFAKAYQERYDMGGMGTGRPRGVHLDRGA